MASFFFIDDRVEFFDSFGLPPVANHFLDFIQINGGDATCFNNTPLQSLDAVLAELGWS